VLATTTKLARALWIVPVTLGLGAWVRRRGSRRQEGSRPKPPWFVLGFLGASAIVTFLPAFRASGVVVAEVARRGHGIRPLFQGVLLWLFVGAGSLAAIATGLATP